MANASVTGIQGVEHDAWTNLHPDLLHEIAKNVHSYADHVRLRAVCKKWNLELPKFPTEIKNLWLVLPFGDENESVGPFYSVGEKKVYPFKLLEMRKKVILGSYDGWLITVGIDGEIQMLNPFTKTHINLPPMSTFPDVIGHDLEDHGYEYTIRECTDESKYPRVESKYHMQKIYIRKVIMWSPPSYEDQGFMAMAIYGDFGKLAYCKLGDNKWTNPAVTEEKPQYRDAVYHQGKIYAVNAFAEFHEISIEAGLMNKIPPPVPMLAFNSYRNFIYVVATQDGLIMVIRRVEFHPDFFYGKTHGFDIYRKLNDRDEDWSRVNNLGDYVLMLGYNSSVCMLPHAFPDKKGNRIYYANDLIQRHYFQPLGSYDVGFFDLEDGTIHQLYPTSDNIVSIISHSAVSPAPVWLLYKTS